MPVLRLKKRKILSPLLRRDVISIENVQRNIMQWSKGKDKKRLAWKHSRRRDRRSEGRNILAVSTIDMKIMLVNLGKEAKTTILELTETKEKAPDHDQGPKKNSQGRMITQATTASSWERS